MCRFGTLSTYIQRYQAYRAELNPDLAILRWWLKLRRWWYDVSSVTTHCAAGF